MRIENKFSIHEYIVNQKLEIRNTSSYLNLMFYDEDFKNLKWLSYQSYRDSVFRNKHRENDDSRKRKKLV